VLRPDNCRKAGHENETAVLSKPIWRGTVKMDESSKKLPGCGERAESAPHPSQAEEREKEQRFPETPYEGIGQPAFGGPRPQQAYSRNAEKGQKNNRPPQFHCRSTCEEAKER
jgi:hypothetical protein